MRKQTVRAPRYGNYLVTRAAAVPKDPLPAPAQASIKPPRWHTLWAERPLELPQGRALGLRQRGEELEVAFISKVTLSLRWEPAERVLSAKQAKAWRERSAFLRG